MNVIAIGNLVRLSLDRIGVSVFNIVQWMYTGDFLRSLIAQPLIWQNFTIVQLNLLQYWNY